MSGGTWMVLGQDYWTYSAALTTKLIQEELGERCKVVEKDGIWQVKIWRAQP